MEGAGGDVFAGAAFAGEEDGGQGVKGGLLEFFEDDLHGRGSSYGGVGLGRGRWVGVLDSNFGALEGGDEFGHFDGLGEVVEKAVSGEGDGFVQVRLPGYHEDGGVGIERSYFMEKVVGFSIGQMVIKENEVEGLVLDGLLSNSEVGAMGKGASLLGDDLGDHGGEGGIVFNQEGVEGGAFRGRLCGIQDYRRGHRLRCSQICSGESRMLM